MDQMCSIRETKLFEISEIEQQYREMVNKLKRMNEAVKSHESRKEIYRIFDDVISFTELHFSTQERLMVQSGFPETEAHRDHGKQLLMGAHLFRKKLDDVGEGMFREWFNHWYYANVVTHIRYANNQIENHLNNHRLKPEGLNYGLKVRIRVA
jgi:hemerythrin